MDRRPFHISDAFRFGWKTTLANLGALLPLGVVALGLSVVGSALQRNNGGGALLALALQPLQAGLALVLMRFSLKLHDGKSAHLADASAMLEGFWRAFAVMVLLGLMVTLGLVLLVVPGVVVGLGFGFAPFLIADGERDLVQAFRLSWRLTAHARGRLALLGLCLMGLNLAGALAFGVGVIFTLPMSVLVAAYALRRLQGGPEVVHFGNQLKPPDATTVLQ
jgi:uncharacterized membrane protein